MTSVILATELLLSLSLAGAAAPNIVHEPLPCVAPGRNPVVGASIPGADVRTAKVYFRSDKYPKFYYVEMQPSPNGFLSVLPKPSPETASIIYYIEAVDVTFDNSIGVEYTAMVSEDCPPPGEASESPAPPEIVVGATDAAAAALPPGFETAGIVGTITAAGVGSIVSGGSGVGTAAVVGGVAAGVGGIGAAVAVVNEPTDDEPAPEPAASVPAPVDPPPPPAPPPPPTTGTPPPPPPTPDDGDDAPAPPPSPPPPPPPPPPAPPVTACFTVSFPGRSCNMKLVASCSTGPVVSYAWVIGASPELGGTTTHAGASINRNFPTCSGEMVDVTLTVANADAATDVAGQTVTLPMELLAAADAPRVMVMSFLDAGAGGAHRGMIVANGTSTASVRGDAPSEHELAGRVGRNVIDATLVSEVGSETRWELDLSASARFVPGSLRPLQGSVVLLEGGRVVFRLAGASGERVRFEYRLSPR